MLVDWRVVPLATKQAPSHKKWAGIAIGDPLVDIEGVHVHLLPTVKWWV